MAALDWGIVAAYLVAAVLIGVTFAKRANVGTTDFFVAGRSLPWYVAGTSMVATTFSSDTPLFVAGAARNEGIYANWIWWSAGIGIVVSVFFFAGLWRRTEAVTEIELIAQRYDKGPAADALRIAKALFDGVFVNCIVMASVTLAMGKIVVVILDLSSAPVFTLPIIGGITPATLTLAVLGTGAVLYTILSGIYGVVYTDLIQFGLAMVGAVALFAIVNADLAASGGLAAGVAAAGTEASTLSMFPEIGANLETATLAILLTVGWWHAAPGTGYFVQRILATRSERDALLSVYWYAFCHFGLRSWPWILVGAASLVYFPALADPEQSYPHMIERFLPAGLKGVMVASLLAAFMSTLDTHMNWGASYLVNDVYAPYVVPERAPRHYVKAARVAMLALVVLAVVVAAQMESILGIYKYLAVILTGPAFVAIARWYWWRINIYSELSALATAAVVGNAALVILPDASGEDWFAVRMLATVAVTTAVAVAVTLWTSTQGPSRQAVTFYTRMRIHGPGWSRVARQTGIDPLPGGLKVNLVACLASIALLYSLLLGIGHALLERWGPTAGCAAVAAVAVLVLARTLPRSLAQLRRPSSGVACMAEKDPPP